MQDKKEVSEVDKKDNAGAVAQDDANTEKSKADESEEKHSMGIIDSSNEELKSKRLHSIRKLIKESDFFASQENNEIDLDNERQVAAMSQRLQESILANGEHNDDAYEIQESDDYVDESREG